MAGAERGLFKKYEILNSGGGKQGLKSTGKDFLSSDEILAGYTNNILVLTAVRLLHPALQAGIYRGYG